jgi:lipopolysaccharide export system permease protein
MRNVFLLGLAVSAVGLAINENVIPGAARRTKQLDDHVKAILRGRVVADLIGNQSFIFQDYDNGRLARVIVARKFEEADPPRPALMRDVTYVSYHEGRVEMIVEAERAEWVGADRFEKGKQQWRFHNANSQLMMRLTPGRRIQVHSETLDFVLNKAPRQVMQETRGPEQMSYVELRARLEAMTEQGVRGRVLREFAVEMERKLALPFTALVVALIGAPLGIRRHRSTTGVGIGLSLLIIVAFYFVMGSFGVLGQGGQVSPVVAAWAPNGVGLLFGCLLCWRVSR